MMIDINILGNYCQAVLMIAGTLCIVAFAASFIGGTLAFLKGMSK